MDSSHHNTNLTTKLYVLAGVLFGTYGSRVCPMLETLTAMETLTHVSIVFAILLVIRLTVATRWAVYQQGQYIKLDTALFFLISIPLATYYNLSYEFPLDSNLKVLFGMALFGFFTGSILELESKLKQMETYHAQGTNDFQLSGVRQSLVKQLISLVMVLLTSLTLMLSMVAIKDVFWLEHNPDRILDGTGKISIMKEFAYLSLVLGGYAVVIMTMWSKLIKKVLLSHECALIEVTKGNIQSRLPVFNHDELGSMALLTNNMLDSLQSVQQEVKATRDVAIVSLSALAESRDNETGAHIIRTQEYVKALAEHMSQSEKHAPLLTPEYIELLYKSAPLHDVGKVGVPDNVLLKPGKLTDEEFAIMKKHPEIGAEALSIAESQLGSCSFLRVAKEISLTHHEKWNGQGYPNQLAGEDIPLSGRLMTLADVYDALISKRVYKPAFSHEKAKGIIIEGKGQHFDPDVVEAFLAVEQQFVEIAATHKDGKLDLSELERENLTLQPA